MPIVPQVTTGSFPPSQTSPHDFSLGVGVGAAVGATVGVAVGARVGATVGATVSARVGRAVGGAPAVEPHAARPTAAIAVPMMVVSFMSAAPPLHRPSSWPVQDPSCTPSRTHDGCHTHSTRTRHPLLRTTGFIAPGAQAVSDPWGYGRAVAHPRPGSTDDRRCRGAFSRRAARPRGCGSSPCCGKPRAPALATREQRQEPRTSLIQPLVSGGRQQALTARIPPRSARQTGTAHESSARRRTPWGDPPPGPYPYHRAPPTGAEKGGLMTPP